MKLFSRETHDKNWSAFPSEEETELANGAAALIRRPQDAVLIAAPGARVLVGARAAAPIEVLGAGAFRVDGAEFRLRHEALAAPAPFPAELDPRACGRCKLDLCEGDAVVRCRCGAFVHEGVPAAGSEPLLCFSYLSHCPCGVDRSELERGEPEDGDA